MATAEAEKIQEKISSAENEMQPLMHQPICSRCGGLMVREFCMDLFDSTSELDCPVARCVQCGDVVDPIIRRNRRLQQQAGVARESRASNLPVHNRASV